jgi:hypothetical protein
VGTYHAYHAYRALLFAKSGLTGSPSQKKPGGRGLVSIVQLIRKLLRLQIGNGGTSFNDYVKTRCCKRSGFVSGHGFTPSRKRSLNEGHGFSFAERSLNESTASASRKKSLNEGHGFRFAQKVTDEGHGFRFAQKSLNEGHGFSFAQKSLNERHGFRFAEKVTERRARL